ncbi:hypothetical protein [Janibacter terrae]|uniref:hypothetical protein n=1 Tax=Janibacter terrae TaxID=103817 RepID=UPI0031F8E8B2
MSIYHLANTSAQWFAKAYPGAKITPNCGVLHTTEGATWPGYGGGASAPSYTALPDIKRQELVWRAHFPDEMSARALVNSPGGVETNTANVVQVELVGTCDDKHAVSWPGVGKAGVDYIYWPDAPEWCLQGVADFLADMHRRHGIPLEGPDVWLRYGKDIRRPGVWPASYGASPARFTFAQWRSFEGWCGHQHVPENSHGDPGALPFARIVALAKGGTTTITPQEDDTDMASISDITKAVRDGIGAHWSESVSIPGETKPRTRNQILIWGYTRAGAAARDAQKALAIARAVARQQGLTDDQLDEIEDKVDRLIDKADS